MLIETLDFEVTVSGMYWDKKPQYSIWMDDQQIIHSAINDTSPQTHKFKYLANSGSCCLKIRLENKTSQDTVVENGEVIKDMLLNIDNIKIDDISLDMLMWTETHFVLDEPHEYQGKTITQLDNCVNLGWNGSYTLDFTSPFYNWLLEKV